MVVERKLAITGLEADRKVVRYIVIYGRLTEKRKEMAAKARNQEIQEELVSNGGASDPEVKRLMMQILALASETPGCVKKT